MHITILLCLFFCFTGSVQGQVKTSITQQFVPCIEYGRNCLAGIERCHENQVCILEPWIGYLSACLTSLAVAVIVTVIYLKDRQLFNLLIAIAFGAAAFGFLISTICYAVIKEKPPPASVSESGFMKTDLTELAESETEASGMIIGTTDLSFLKALVMTTLSLYIFIVAVIVLYYNLYFCALNRSKI